MADKLNQYGNFCVENLVLVFSYNVRFFKDTSAVVIRLS